MSIVPYADVIEVKTRFYNGKMQYGAGMQPETGGKIRTGLTYHKVYAQGMSSSISWVSFMKQA